MIPERFRSTAGQTQAEYSLVVAGIAVAVIVAVLFFGGAATGLWDRSSKPVTPSTFNPPTNTTTFEAPTSEADCIDDGWKRYTDLNFADEPACVAYVNQSN